jgi:hypothetical protein
MSVDQDLLLYPLGIEAKPICAGRGKQMVIASLEAREGLIDRRSDAMTATDPDIRVRQGRVTAAAWAGADQKSPALRSSRSSPPLGNQQTKPSEYRNISAGIRLD